MADQHRPARHTGRAAFLALALAPVIALTACDRIGAMFEKSGHVSLKDVAPDARSIGGAAVLASSAMDQMLAPEPPQFVPGKIIVGAKVQDQLAHAASLLGIPFSNQFTDASGTPLDIDDRIEARATQDAVAEAKRDAHTVLARMKVEGEIEVAPTGVVTIDLTSTASPTGLSRLAQAAGAAEGAAAAKPEEAQQVVDTGMTCPRDATKAQLDADLTLKTVCTVERLKASRQFDYVDKNYVIDVGFDRLPIFGKKAPSPAPKSQPSAPATAPGAEVAATGALPDDPLLPLQWDMRARGSGPDKSPGGAGFETFWTALRQVGHRSVTVAVIDTGIDKSHPDMKASPNLASGVDLVTDYDRAGDGDGVDRDANDPGDACGAGKENSFHGTHVAGTIGAAATNDRRGVAGAAWNVTVLPVRAIGHCGGELEDIINAIRWSAGLAPVVTEAGEQIVNSRPADIINMSLSVQIACPASMQAAIDAAVAKGVVIVVAAGNKNDEVKNYAPSNCRNVVVVAANDAKGALAFYSNYGPEVTVLAPGGDLFNDSDGDGRPDGILSTRTTTKDCYDPETRQAAATCYYGYLQGTSMAAPHVAAALALLKSQYNLSGKALETFMLNRAMSPIDGAAQCPAACDKANATPVPGQPGKCYHICGRGMLDLARLAPTPAAPAGGGR